MATMPRNETPQRTAGKRPLRALTPQEKLDAIKRVHEGESKASVARDIGVPESTLRGWCKAEHKIISQVNTMKNSHYDRLSSPSESDRSTPGSSSRPPSANLTSAPATTKESSEEAEPPAKRVKVDTADIPSTSTSNSGMYYDPTTSQNLLTTYLYTLMTQPALKNAFLEHQMLMNNKALLSSIPNTANLTLDGGFSSSGYSNNAVSLSMVGNSILSQRELNGKRTRHRANVSSFGNTFARTPKRQSLSPTVERENLSLTVPSTSASMINGNHTVGTPAMSKPLQEGKHINDIAQQLLKQKVEEQQQQQPQPQPQPQSQPQPQPNNLSRNSELLSQWVRLHPTRNMLDGQPMPGNSVNNNNNNIHKNNNESANINRKSKFMDYLPPGIHEAADHGAKFVDWLRKHGSVFTFQQVKPVETIVDQIVAWAKPKELKTNNKSNSMS